MTVRQKFAKDHGLTVTGVNDLVRLAEIVAKRQERDHNGTGSEKATDEAERLFNQSAHMHGFTHVRWPGLYPQVSKDGVNFFDLPE